MALVVKVYNNLVFYHDHDDIFCIVNIYYSYGSTSNPSKELKERWSLGVFTSSELAVYDDFKVEPN